jgi:hypothetical protein
MVLLYFAIYIIQSLLTGIDPITIRVAYASICIVVVTVVLFVTMVPKLGYILELIKAKTHERHPKPFFDDIEPTSGDRERLENGTKQEKIAICQKHLMVWSHMLAAATNSEFKSKSGDNSKESAPHEAGALKSEQKSKRIKSHAPPSHTPSHAPPIE